MQAMTNAKSYDWATWLVGILRSIISGGATGILNTGGTALVIPETVNAGAGLHKMLALLAVYFVLGAIVHMAIFLSTHGAPDQLTQSLQTAATATAKAGEAISEAQSQTPKTP